MAAVIRREGALLLALRPPHKRHGGLWEFPGGKVLEGESPLEALRRELAEELGVEVVEAGAVLFRAADPGSPFVIDFVEAEISGEPEAREHVEVRWVDEGDVGALPLAPADGRFWREGRGGDGGRGAGRGGRGARRP